LNATTSTVTGLTQLGARLYDASLGRFLSVDAVLSPFNPVQNNGYSYSGNSPIGRSDPSGNYYVGGSLGDCGSSGCSGSAGTSGTAPPAAKKGPSAKKGPGLGSILKKYWDTSWDNEGQFLLGIADGVYGIGKFFLWDSSIIGTSVKAADSIGCLANYSSCEKQQEAAAAPWQKDFWGTAEKTFIQPTIDDWTSHPAHALGELVADVGVAAATGGAGGALIKGARVAEEAGAAADTAEAASAAEGSAGLSAGWRATTFESASDSFDYHFARHGEGVTPQQYAKDAEAWARNPGGTPKPVTLGDGMPGVRYRTPGGARRNHGRGRTCHYILVPLT
jgi:RHS repeat-associated protein